MAEEDAARVVTLLDGFSVQCPQQWQRIAASDVGWTDVQEFYRMRNNLPQWQDVTQRNQLGELFGELRYDGLPAESYRGGLSAAGQADALDNCTDVAVSHDFLRALKHLHGGVLDQDKVEPYWVEDQAAARPLKRPAQLAEAGRNDLAKAFIDARPAHTLYWQLREQLRVVEQELQQAQQWPEVRLQRGVLRPGGTDTGVSQLRERLLQAGYLTADTAGSGNTYSTPLVEAIKTFQADHYLDSDGVIGPATLNELNVSYARRQMQIRVNLERMRWLDRFMEPNLLVVDIAGARLIYLQQGEVAWRTRTQVGAAARKTPLLKSRITHLTVNPTWTVPPTIFKKDKLPAIQRDIGYLQRSRMQVINGQGLVLDPYQVNWEAPGNIMLRQAAGAGNALGRVAIRFANPFAVYLHDTPSKHLFSRANRTVSSGCVRVEDVFDLVGMLAGDDTTRNRVDRVLKSGKTQQVNLPEATPVLLAYWTVEVDADGRLRYRADTYDLDGKVAAALAALR